MRNRIVVKRNLFDKVMKANPLDNDGELTNDELWIALTHALTTEKGLDSIVDEICNCQYYQEFFPAE